MSPSCFSFFKPKPRSDKRDPGPAGQLHDSLETSSTVSTLVSSTEEWKLGEKGSQRWFKVDTTERLKEIRALMKEHDIDYYVVPTDDAHQSEYVAKTDRRREFISGFTGSAGQAIIATNEAYLLTDSRYWLQAEAQLDGNWGLVKIAGPSMPKSWVEWLLTQVSGSRIGIDARFITQATTVLLNTRFKRTGSEMVYPEENLVDAVWKDKPSPSEAPVFIQPYKFTGEHARDKLSKLREWVREQGDGLSLDQTDEPAGTLISDLPAIAYLLNLRGQDIPYNPLFKAYLFVGSAQATLFLDPSKVPEGVSMYLTSFDVEVCPYDDVWDFLKRRKWGEKDKVIITPQTSHAVSRAISPSNALVLTLEVDNMKAIKNGTELEGFRKAYLRDGACFVRFFAWLESEISEGHKITEWEAAQWLDEERLKAEYNMGQAYGNISGSGPNAALPHYVPTKETARIIDTETPYLNDSGGQYLDGTCDTTRTIHFGTPTEEQSEAFTRVLQGHIALDTAVFPEGTTGLQLDVLARNKLWKDGLNYLHGTGHGFGSFLTVHEGPQGFGIHVPFKPGHVVTNEPGFYQAEEFGIRIESALIVKRVKTKRGSNGDIWLGFERLTQVPIDARLVKKELLTVEEKRWLKEHNGLCVEKLTPLLAGDELSLSWLEQQARLANSIL
ncbi:hypothetical protein V5O48_007844 [Marasmius crinis-equi]|uniref:Creatinase/aminopeptidase n=1 Tax=Marasmius crinis-equi TaxID=585013 RepID=A0ABR3FFM0_9AGAR